MTTVSISGVSKVYPGHSDRDEPVLALRNVSFSVNKYEFCSILGHSGCGKTTLLTMMAGFEHPTEGELLIDGERVSAPGWERSVIFQDYALFPWLTVERNIAFGLEMKKEPLAQRQEIVRKHVDLVGLKGFEHRYPHQLSGGMKQRVSIARALAVDPHVLLMDEPFAALDAQNRAMMQQEMIRILENERKTVVLVTHSIEEAIALSDRIVVMTKRPGTVKSNIEVTLPRPRSEEDPEVIRLKKTIRALISTEFEAET